MPYRAVSWRGASIEWRCPSGKGEHVIASVAPAGQKMMKLSSHSQSSVYVLCFAAASLDAPSSSRTARRCIAPLTANPKPRPVPAVVAARRPRASSIPSARMRREEKKKRRLAVARRSALLLPPLGSRRRPPASLPYARPYIRHHQPPSSRISRDRTRTRRDPTVVQSIARQSINHMAYLRVHSFASSWYLLGSVL